MAISSAASSASGVGPASGPPILAITWSGTTFRFGVGASTSAATLAAMASVIVGRTSAVAVAISTVAAVITSAEIT